MFSKITTRRRHSIAAGSARRRALAVETLEGRSLLAVTGFDSGGGVDGSGDGGVWNPAGSPAQYAAMAAPAAPSHAASASAGLLGAPLAARGFAWRFGDGFYAQGADASSRVSPFSPQFSAVLVSPSPRGPDAGYAKAYVLPSAEGGSFGCVVVICATSLDGSASQLGQSVALGGVLSQRSTYLSSIDRAFDIKYDAPAQIWRLTPSETLSRLLHDAWIGERRGDSAGKEIAHTGDRMNAGMGADRDDGPMAGRTDDGDYMRGGMNGDLGGETGGFLALSTAGDMAMSSAVANIFADAAQRAAPSVVSRSEASVKNLVASAIGSDVNSSDVNSADVAPSVITRTENIGAAVNNPASLDSPTRSDSATTAPATQRADVDVAAEVPSTTASTTTASSRAAHRALDAANLGAAASDASSEQDGDDADASPVASDTSSDANRFAAADAAAATTIHDAGVWVADEGQGGMIALAASYLPSEAEPAHPAADAWLVENVRPRVDGELDEPRFESNVGIFQVLDVAAAPPLAGRITELPRHVVTTAVVLPLAEGDVPATEEDSTTEPARVETAAVDQHGLGPHYAVAVAAALAASAGVTLRGRRPLEAVKRIVERARGQVTTGGK